MAKTPSNNSGNISVDQALLLADSEISKLPKNRLVEYMPVIEKLKSEKVGYKDIAKFFDEKLGIPVKAFDVKKAYENKHPPKPRNKKADNENLSA